MKIFQKIGMSALVACMALFAACSDDLTYTPGEDPAGQKVYFSSELGSEVLVAKDATSVTIPVTRGNTAGAYTAVFEVITLHGNVFNIPSSVTFADGQKTASVVITFNFADLDVDTPYDVALKITDASNTTPYGKSTYAFSIKYPAPWTSLGMGDYTEDLLTAAYGIGNDTFKVEIQESDATPGLYRLKNLFHISSPFFELYNFSDGHGTSTEYYIEINATDPQNVTIAEQPLGFTMDAYGDLGVKSVAGGKMVNKVITFPVKGLALNVPKAGVIPTNASGLFRVMLPGAVVPAEINVDYKGQYMSPNGKNNAIFAFKMVATATSFKYAVVNGDISKNPATVETVGAGIVDGSITSVEQTASGNYIYELTAAGKYTVVVVPFDAKNNVGTIAAKAFTFTTGGDQVTLKTGNYQFEVGTGSGPYTNKITVTDGPEANKYYVDGLFDYAGFMWLAEFDPINLTLTLDGTAITSDDPKEFPTFMKTFAWYNKDKGWIAALQSGTVTGKEPCVISVTSDGKLEKFTSQLALIVIDNATGNNLGMAEKIAVDTAISEAVAAPSAVAKGARIKGAMATKVSLVK